MITRDPITLIPRKMVNINVVPESLKDGRIALTEKNAEKVFKDYLEENINLYRVRPADLKMISARQRQGTWFIKFQQYYRDIPVYKATVGFTATEDGMIKTYGSSFHPGIDLDTEPKIKLPEAVEIARRTYKTDAGRSYSEHEATLLIYHEKEDSKIRYYLAWKFLLKGKRPDPRQEMYFIIDAVNGNILKSYTARFPGARAFGKVQGEIYPENPTNPPIATEPLKHSYVDIRWAGRVTTDQNGDYSQNLPWYFWIFRKYRATFRLEGPYARVQDNVGNDYTATRTRRKNRACDHTWTAADRDHINVFYHINVMHDWFKSWLNHNWVNAWDNSSCFDAEVNHADNNAYAGSPMEYGIDNFARSSDVIYHECTHNVLYYLYGDWIGWPDANEEWYAFDEGFSDYFAGSITEDPAHGEGWGSTRTLDNNDQYPDKNTYFMDGHDGGQIIGGAAWDLREELMNLKGDAVGSRLADNYIFDALEYMATLPRDYYFSDPQESNLLSCLYIAYDNNNNLNDGIPHFFYIHHAFRDHNLLQAVILDKDSYDVSTNTIGTLTGGDFYYFSGSFWANNWGQRGVVDLGDIGNVDLEDVDIPITGYTRFGVAAALNHTFVSLAQTGEEGSYIVFRVNAINAGGNEVVIEYLYRTPFLVDIAWICLRYPYICRVIYPCDKYPFLCEPYVVLHEEELLKFKFRHELDRVIIPVEKICQYVIDCPGCGPRGLCAGYEFYFKNMEEPFGIEVFNSQGKSVVSNMRDIRDKKIAFRTSRDERYFLVIYPGKNTKVDIEYELPITGRGLAK
ncbi:MAG: hypothetical protein JSV33_02360 [bacterium]|nr:MAG: hypothetical protein JSV33_02360 [bacterium]